MTNPHPYTLGGVRALFRDRSGRYDLASAANVDAGADVIINSAQDWLDRQCGWMRRLVTRYAVALPAGGYLLTPGRLRWVEAVWVHTASGQRKLERKSADWVRQAYPAMLSNLDANVSPPTGRVGIVPSSPPSPSPATNCWAPWPIGPAPAQNDLTQFTAQGTRLGTDGLTTGDWYGDYGIVIAPPLAEAATVEVWGAFYSPRLINDTDQSFWTHHPDILVAAALMELELSNRNSEGARDQEAAVRMKLAGLEADQAHEDSRQADYMGSEAEING
jgi:hypothetical protein